MEFLVLGPLEVRDDDGLRPLGGPRQRTLLAHLILRAGRLVPVETLIDAVWGEEPPRTARNTLQTYVFRLRRAIGDERIEGTGNGYVLRAAPAEIDAVRFETLVRQARDLAAADPAGAEARSREALAIWRGPALADLADEPSLRGDITRLEELRLAATEQRISAELALGRHTTILGELEQLTADYPMRERLWASLMLALYRTGRQGDALDAYQRAREVLGEELGIDPSPELQRMHEQILGQDPDLKVGARPPARAVLPGSLPGDLEPGTEFAGYRIESVLGRGGMSVVYLAEHLGLQRKAALKVMAPQLAHDERFRERFVRESRIAASIEHPNIVPIYEAGDAQDHLFIAMRYVRGTDLRRLLEHKEQLDPPRAVRIVGDVAEALDAAHAAGLVHRDVKPGNILIVEAAGSGGRDLVYLSDFGLTKRLESGDKLTKTGQFVGTVDYVAPEQVEGRQIDARTDVYSLACVLFECLTGKVPYGRDTDVAALYAHLREKPPTLTSFRPNLPAALNGVFARALSKLPTKRQATTGGFAEEASSALGLRPTADGARKAAARAARSVPSAVGAALTVALLAGGIVYAVTRDEPPAGTPQEISPSLPLGEGAFFAVIDRPLEEGDEQRLASYVPATFRGTCQPSTPVPPQLLAAIACLDGRQQVRYELFPTASAMDAGFDETVSSLEAPAGDCAVEHEATSAYSVAGTQAGRVLCYETSDRSNIEWTTPGLLVHAHAIRQDLGDLSLYEWWVSSAGPVDTTVESPEISKDVPVELPPPPQGLFLTQISSGEAESPRLRFNVSKTETRNSSWEGTWDLRLAGSAYSMQHDGLTVEGGMFAFGKGPSLVFDATSGVCKDDPAAVYAVSASAEGTALDNERSVGQCLPGPWPVNTHPWVQGPSGEIDVLTGNSISSLDLAGTDPVPSELIAEADGPFAWSPDGSRIAFTRGAPETHMDLWIAEADGSNGQQLTDQPGHVFDPSWSPDGTRILIHSDAREDERVFRPSHLLVVNADGSGSTQLASFRGNVGFASLSPDGKRLAYWLAGTIYVASADATGPRRPIVRKAGTSSEYRFSWTPDGRRIIFWSDVGSEGGFSVVDADGSHLRSIGAARLTDLGTQSSGCGFVPDLSPDGSWIVFGGWWCGLKTAVFLLNVQGGPVFQISPLLGEQPTWRPASVASR